MSREPKRPSRLADVLAAFVASHPSLSSRLDAASAVDAWAGAVGPQIAAVARARHVAADGALVVEVTTHAWMQELSLLEPDLIARLSAAPGGSGVRKLRFLLARK